jgi:hypothetical protein
MAQQLTMAPAARPSEHRSFPRLTAEQKRSINEVWDEFCVPALKEVDVMKQQVLDARLEAQDARDALRQVRQDYDRLRWLTRGGA